MDQILYALEIVISRDLWDKNETSPAVVEGSNLAQVMKISDICDGWCIDNDLC